MKIYGNENNAYILRELGQRLKDIRISRSLTQKELAQDAGVSYNTLIRIENGDGANIENLIRVMRTLGLLQNFDLLIPEQNMTAEEFLYEKPKRQRVSKAKKENRTDWVWGDEK